MQVVFADEKFSQLVQNTCLRKLVGENTCLRKYGNNKKKTLRRGPKTQYVSVF